VVRREIPMVGNQQVLTGPELSRYSRHLIMPEVGLDGQGKFKDSSVLIVGAGGLGTPSATYLAAAGIGRIGIVDFDVVEASNLHRQVLFGEDDLGRSKAEVIKERLRRVNPHVQVDVHRVRLDSSNALQILADYDIVVDGTDNFPTRYLINDACVLLNKPNVYASVFRFDGQASIFLPGEGPCYRCLYPEPPPPGLVPSCAEGGVLGVLPGIMGSIQAVQVINLILAKGKLLVGRLLLFDAANAKFTELSIAKNPDCPICGPNPTIRGLIDYDEFCGTGREIELGAGKEIVPTTLKNWLDSGREVVLLDVREPFEARICAIDGSHLIPLGDLPRRVNELDTADDIVVYCRSGSRSAQAVQLLSTLGFTRAQNLKGGILAWGRDVDPAINVY
jgi:molybdopterin/thiamine biosynthesis adenylyltransferase/rhodanese-related sulfurtransferase